MSSSNRRYYLVKRCKAWNQESSMELYDWLSELTEIAEEQDEDIYNYISPEDIPTAQLPYSANLTGVWACDKKGVVLRTWDGALEVIGASQLPKLGKIGASKPKLDNAPTTTITLRVRKDWLDSVNEHCWDIKMKRPDFIRAAIDKAIEEGL